MLIIAMMIFVALVPVPLQGVIQGDVFSSTSENRMPIGSEKSIAERAIV